MTVQHSGTESKIGWLSAFRLWLKDPRASLLLKLLLAPAVAWLPFDVANDVLAPGLGFSDDLPMAVVLFLIYRGINKHRTPAQHV